jgi:3-methyladenine DNA glycosylase AlkD
MPTPSRSRRKPTVQSARKALRAAAEPERVPILQRFFKTGPGEYAEGDVFLGVTVPRTREVATAFADLSLSDVHKLLHSRLHEERLLALLILVRKYQRGDPVVREKVFNLYLSNLEWINNWDLVDVSAEHIIGAQLIERDRRVLHTLAASRSLWRRRVAIIATFHFIKRNDFSETLSLAEKLLQDEHDLIHKAVGWMLREIGKRDRSVEEYFLRKHSRQMPRTMLRYAIEKFPEPLRQAYLRTD